MRTYSLHHVSDATLLRDLKHLVARDRATTAAILAHIAEVDERRLYAPAGYSSMHMYCVGELGLSDGSAYKRITAARAARRYPVLFSLVARGRLHLTAVRLLAPNLTPGNVEELLAAAEGMRSAQLESMLASRFGSPAEPTRIRPVVEAGHQPQPVSDQSIELDFENSSQLAASPVGGESAVPPVVPGAALTPLAEAASAAPPESPAAPSRYVLQVTIGKETHDKLRRLQALLGHAIPSGDVAQVLDRAFDALLSQVERRKLAAVAKPRSADRAPRGAHGRRIPAALRRAVWKRDRGECTFVGENGRRCRSRTFLEFDHIEPVASGGATSEDNLRLRCRAHNQFEAERHFGRQFMAGKRAQESPAPGGSWDLRAGLRELGLTPDEVRRGARYAETLRTQSYEDRLRAALHYLRARPRGAVTTSR